MLLVYVDYHAKTEFTTSSRFKLLELMSRQLQKYRVWSLWHLPHSRCNSASPCRRQWHAYSSSLTYLYQYPYGADGCCTGMSCVDYRRGLRRNFSMWAWFSVCWTWPSLLGGSGILAEEPQDWRFQSVLPGLVREVFCLSQSQTAAKSFHILFLTACTIGKNLAQQQVSKSEWYIYTAKFWG